MKNWLLQHGLPGYYLRYDLLQFPTEKPAAFLTIDDRCICFDGTFPSTEEMLSFQPWYRRS